MTEAMERLTPSERQFAASEIERTLSRWNLPSTGPVKADLQSRVQVVGQRNFAVRVVDDANRLITLGAEEIENSFKEWSTVESMFAAGDPGVLDYWAKEHPHITRSSENAQILPCFDVEGSHALAWTALLHRRSLSTKVSLPVMLLVRHL
jgi:hypothetical protein